MLWCKDQKEPGPGKGHVFVLKHLLQLTLLETLLSKNREGKELLLYEYHARFPEVTNASLGKHTLETVCLECGSPVLVIISVTNGELLGLYFPFLWRDESNAHHEMFSRQIICS